MASTSAERPMPERKRTNSLFSKLTQPFRRASRSGSGSATIDQVYTFGGSKDKELGKGTTSIVRKGVHKKTGEVFAIKIVDLSVLSPEQVKRCHTEVEILKSCDHPNIITLHEVFSSGNKLYLVLDMMAGGDLFDRIVNREKFAEKDAINVMRKVISALEYLHSRGIVHRDLKPENLLYAGPEDDSEIKIADFGLSKVNFNPSITNSPCGTPGWCAPEILRRKHYGKAIDMWSIGVILYTMLVGYPPFDLTISTPKLHEKVEKGEFDFPPEDWSKISREAKDIVQHLMADDARRRYTARQALDHPWLSRNFQGGNNMLDSPGRLRRSVGARKSVEIGNSVQRLSISDGRPAPNPGQSAQSRSRATSGSSNPAPNSIFSYSASQMRK